MCLSPQTQFRCNVLMPEFVTEIYVFPSRFRNAIDQPRLAGYHPEELSADVKRSSGLWAIDNR